MKIKIILMSVMRNHIEGLNVGHKRILDLSKPENYSVVMLLIKLFKKRLFKKCNYFRKTMTIRT